MNIITVAPNQDRQETVLTWAQSQGISEGVVVTTHKEGFEDVPYWVMPTKGQCYHASPLIWSTRFVEVCHQAGLPAAVSSWGSTLYNLHHGVIYKGGKTLSIGKCTFGHAGVHPATPHHSNPSVYGIPVSVWSELEICGLNITEIFRNGLEEADFEVVFAEAYFGTLQRLRQLYGCLPGEWITLQGGLRYQVVKYEATFGGARHLFYLKGEGEAFPTKVEKYAVSAASFGLVDPSPKLSEMDEQRFILLGSGAQLQSDPDWKQALEEELTKVKLFFELCGEEFGENTFSIGTAKQDSLLVKKGDGVTGWIGWSGEKILYHLKDGLGKPVNRQQILKVVDLNETAQAVFDKVFQ